jgi:hypothetical protein
MKLALRELGRRPGRFATATVILTLIAILLMFLGGILDGLISSSTGAIKAQDGDAIVWHGSATPSTPSVPTPRGAWPSIGAFTASRKPMWSMAADRSY